MHKQVGTVGRVVTMEENDIPNRDDPFEENDIDRMRAEMGEALERIVEKYKEKNGWDIIAHDLP